MYSETEEQSQFIQSEKVFAAKCDRSVDNISIIGAWK